MNRVSMAVRISQRAVPTFLAVMATGFAVAQPPPGVLAWPPMGTKVVVEREASGSYGPRGAAFGGAAGRVAWTFERREWKGLSGVAAVSAEDKTPLFDVESGATVAELDNTGRPVWSYEPPLRSIHWPLAVGKTWTSEARLTEESYGSKPVIPIRMEVRVDAYEDVTVPAGTFKAFKIVSTTPGGWISQHWVVPSLGLLSYFAVKGIEERPPSNLLGVGRREWKMVALTLPAR